MALEIERKFLVDEHLLDLTSAAVRSTAAYLKQGYLSMQPVVRVRAGDTKAWLTIKGGASGITRNEYEYAIPLTDAHELLAMCGPHVLEKTRYLVPFGGRTWEVDRFHGANDGLIVAELELDGEDDVFGVPDWVTAEVTDDPRYSNSQLVQVPFTTWR